MIGSDTFYLVWNDLKLTIRNFSKNKLYVTLNLLGLSMSFAACLFITFYIIYEHSFEDFQQKADQVCRVTYESQVNDQSTHWARVPEDYVNELPQVIAGIKKLVRFQNHEQKYFKVGTRKFREKHVYITDPEVFDLFSFELLYGDPKSALKSPNSLVITEELALKYFGKSEALGESMQVLGDWSPEPTTYRITGVMKDLPNNTHLPVDVLMSFESEEARTWWAYIYVLLAPQADLRSVTDQMSSFVKAHNQDAEVTTSLHLQPLSSIHLHSNLAREIIPNGSLQNVRTLFFVGLLILFIGVINFANLSSVLATSRTREIGIRKFLGAGRGQVIQSSLIESISYSLLALVVGGLLVVALWQEFGNFTGIAEWTHIGLVVLGALVIAILVGVLAGGYPALISTQMSLTSLIKGVGFIPKSPHRAVSFKKVMLIFQFALSSILLIITLVVRDQLHFITQQLSVLDAERILAIPRVPDQVTKEFSLFKQELLKIPGVGQVSSCMEVPSREIRDTGPFKVEGLHNTREEAPHFDVQIVDHDFFDLMNLELIAGASFPTNITYKDVPEFTEDYSHIDYLSDQPRAYLINETAMRQLGWTNPDQAIGQIASWSIGEMQLEKGKIVGVVSDYYQESMKNMVDPTVYLFEPIWLRTFLIRSDHDPSGATLQKVQSVWDQFFADYPMTFHYLDDLYERLYEQEQRQFALLLVFSGMAILIAFVGLLTIVAYAIRLRLKELAIRKVLGARVGAMIHMLWREYSWLLLGGWIIAAPLAFYLSKIWLSTFAYQNTTSIWVYASVFVIVGSVLMIAILTNVVKISKVNPSTILHDE